MEQRVQAGMGLPPLFHQLAPNIQTYEPPNQRVSIRYMEMDMIVSNSMHQTIIYEQFLYMFSWFFSHLSIVNKVDLVKPSKNFQLNLKSLIEIFLCIFSR